MALDLEQAEGEVGPDRGELPGRLLRVEVALGDQRKVGRKQAPDLAVEDRVGGAAELEGPLAAPVSQGIEQGLLDVVLGEHRKGELR